MATKEELYISVTQLNYRTIKSDALMAQADLLKILKKLQNLKVLSRQKQDLKKALQKLISSTLSQIDSIQNKIPTPKIPKTIQIKIEPKIEPKIIHSKKDKIEEELKLISEKLKELNS